MTANQSQAKRRMDTMVRKFCTHPADSSWHTYWLRQTLRADIKLPSRRSSARLPARQHAVGPALAASASPRAQSAHNKPALRDGSSLSRLCCAPFNEQLIGVGIT